MPSDASAPSDASPPPSEAQTDAPAQASSDEPSPPPSDAAAPAEAAYGHFAAAPANAAEEADEARLLAELRESMHRRMHEAGEGEGEGVDAAPPPEHEQEPAAAPGENPLFGYALRNPAWLESYDPVVNERAVAALGAARVSVLRDGLLRLEWSPHSPPRFHDAGSVFAVNRYAPDEEVPAFSASVEGSVLTVETAQVTLTFDAAVDEGRGFTARNTLARVRSLGTQWRPGDAPAGSLRGTIRTLDRMGQRVPLRCEQPAWRNDSHCEEGVASLDGWAVVDDSLGARWAGGSYGRFYVFTEVAPWPWMSGPAEPPPRAAPETCAAAGFERMECVWGNNVDEAACAARGCCFDAEQARAVDGQPPALHFVPWCFWPSPPPEGPAAYQDLYLFASGRDFKGALADFRFVGGRVPLSPRYQLGPHFSRWYPYADFEEREISATHAQLGVPLDAVLIDTDWHSPHERGWPEPRPPPGVHLEPWTGYTIAEELLPAPRRLADHWHARGVRAGFNLHLPPLVPRAGGVQYNDAAYFSMCAVTGQDPARGEPVLGDFGNLTWVSAFLDLVVAPVAREMGLDFWWLDWQQGEANVGPGPGLPITLWLSYIFSSAPQLWSPMARVLRDEGGGGAGGGEEGGEPRHGGADFYPPRPTVMNRWGGLGSHRFPVGFSGDAETSWHMLQLQCYMTPTAANVGLQWSHDIGGFAGQPDGELMVRWTQFGAFSPVLRPHCAGRGGASRDLWAHAWQPALAVLRSYFRLRARLVPYLATAQRVAYDTGVVPVHPIYYEHPHAALAFYEQAQHQFMFGADVLVAPIFEPASVPPPAALPPAGVASRPPVLARATLYFPPGVWIEWLSWQAHTGPAPDGAFFQRLFALDEMPLFSPAGAIVPLRTLPDEDAAAAHGAGHADVLGTAAEVPTALTLWVFPPGPGALGSLDPGEAWATRFSSGARLYDDDGLSVAYAENAGSEFLWTALGCEWQRSTLLEEVAEAPGPAGAAGSEADLEEARVLGADLSTRDRVTCSVGAAEGRLFAAFPRARTYTLRFVAAFPPESVLVNQDADEYFQPAAFLNARGPSGAFGDGGARWPPNANAWAYDAAQASVWVHVGVPASPSNPVRVTLIWPRGARADDALLTSAIARKTARAQAAKREMARISWSAFPVDVRRVLAAANVGARAEEALERRNAAGGGATAAAAAEIRALLAALHGDLEAGLAELDVLEALLRAGGALPPQADTAVAVGADGEPGSGGGGGGVLAAHLAASAEQYAAASALSTMRALLLNGVS